MRRDAVCVLRPEVRSRTTQSARTGAMRKPEGLGGFYEPRWERVKDRVVSGARGLPLRLPSKGPNVLLSGLTSTLSGVTPMTTLTVTVTFAFNLSLEDRNDIEDILLTEEEAETAEWSKEGNSIQYSSKQQSPAQIMTLWEDEGPDFQSFTFKR